MGEQEKHRGGLSRSFFPPLSFVFPLARSLAGARIRQKSTGAGTLNPARVPPHVREAVSVFDCSPTTAAAAVLLLPAALPVRLPSRRQNAISNQFKCKLKTTAAYKLFDSPSKNTASKDQTEDKTRGREGGVYGADGRDRTRKGAPEKGIGERRSPDLLHRTPGCIPLFSLFRQREASRRCLYHPTAERILATYARLPSKYLPFPCSDESWLAVTRFRARARLVQPRTVIASLLRRREKLPAFKEFPPPPSTFSPRLFLSPGGPRRRRRASSARSTYDQKKGD